MMTSKRKGELSPLPLADAQAIVESVVGPVDWKGAVGWCPCPGIGKHTKRNGKADCKVVCEPVPQGSGTLPPGVYCFHNGCAAEVDAASFAVRSALGKRTSVGKVRPVRPFVMPTRPKAPKFDPAKLEAVASKLQNLDDVWFWNRSDASINLQCPAAVLHRLYRPGEKVVIFDVFESQGRAIWMHPGEWENPRALDRFSTGKENGVWFLCNPVNGDYVLNDNENRSRRSWQTVTAWRYLVLESDEANPAHWLSALAQMPLRIAAIYTSGGKSIHALVRVDAGSKAEWDVIADELKPPLITLGADRKAITAVRLTRLPWCERREKQAMQRLLYINPNPDGTPICEQEVIL